METCDLIQCIDKGLDAYGSNAKQAVYLILTLRKGIPYEELTSNPAALDQSLQEVFDDSSAIVKRTIAREIKKVFGLKNISNSNDLAEVLDAAIKCISGISVSEHSGMYTV
jgi:hypothetical protein